MLNRPKLIKPIEGKIENTEIEHQKYILDIQNIIKKIKELIFYETDENSFLNKCCQLLVKQNLFDCALIILFDGAKLTESFFQSSNENMDVEDIYREKSLPYCMVQSYLKSDIHKMNDQNPYCLECPQNKFHKGKSTLTTIVTHKNYFYGFICVPIKNGKNSNENEIGELITEIADSIAMSLWLIKVKKQVYISQKVSEDLNLNEKEGVVFFNFDGLISLFNKRMEQIFNCNATDLKGNNLVKFIKKDLLEEWISTVSHVIEMGFPQCIKTKCIILNRVAEIPIEMRINRLYPDRSSDIGLYAIIRVIDT